MTGEDRQIANLTVEILRDIRDGVQQTNTRLDQTNTRLDQTNARLDRMGEELNARLDQTNDRLDALIQNVEEGFNLLDRRIDNLLLGEHPKEHNELRQRVTCIETHLGFSDVVGELPDS